MRHDGDELLDCEEAAHRKAVRTILVREIPAGQPDGTARLVPEERTLEDVERWERQLAILDRGVASWVGIEGEPTRAALVALYVRFPGVAATLLSAILTEVVRPFAPSRTTPDGSGITQSTSRGADRATRSAARSGKQASGTATRARAHGDGAGGLPTATGPVGSSRRRRA